jgi:hypothetical protein
VGIPGLLAKAATRDPDNGLQCAFPASSGYRPQQSMLSLKPNCCNLCA